MEENKITELERIGIEQRKLLIPKNEYDLKDEYSSGHKNALSDGDTKGKGETETIGSIDDINTRTSNVVKNEYKKENEYSSGHKNALSDGDTKGKGETTTIGSSDDIKTRTFSVARNSYNEKHQYPDFKI